MIQSDSNSFSLPGRSSFCISPRDQPAKRYELAKRSILPITSITKSVLPSRKTTSKSIW